ncbi:hypothetical protein IWW38_000869 [Coemansia aciculifera]|uniref:Uncharacterized protein n=1 Tax=Coemansia aciculifera TaxID=417176 RepID=A0ACC1M8R8_9FUNG|nr:hypothetical protein IWW38_000869 [Coemansia aciculifera]
MNRDVAEGSILKVGRFTEKVSQQMSRIAFKSKVVSRSHAEIWTEAGQFFIKDTKSSSGTFLNHMRLSPPGQESRPHPLHDGDILQLGVDYQGGSVDTYKCVKIRLEINRNWQRSKENPFRRQVLENIQNAYHAIGDNTTGASAAVGSTSSNNECCICLYQMIAFQALFVAPCSHCFHFKCVKPILFTSTGFSCPLCRTYADLEASVTVDENEMDVDSRLPPVILPSAVIQNQHPITNTASVVLAAAEDAVAAAESSVGGGGGGGAGAMEEEAIVMGGTSREDANATPVPNDHHQPPSSSAGSDPFGTTPVGSMPTSLAAQFGGVDANATTTRGAAAEAAYGDADASLVAGISGGGSAIVVDGDDECLQQGDNTNNNSNVAAAGEASI